MVRLVLRILTQTVTEKVQMIPEKGERCWNCPVSVMKRARKVRIVEARRSRDRQPPIRHRPTRVRPEALSQWLVLHLHLSRATRVPEAVKIRLGQEVSMLRKMTRTTQESSFREN